MESTITALEMRKKFGGVLDRVVKKGEHITIMRGHLALAVLIPVKDHQKHCLDKDRARKIEDVLADIDAWKKSNPSKAKRLSRLNAADEVRAMRDSRWSS